MMERIFNDENEPFWRSAKQMELGVIAPQPFAPTSKRIRARPGGAIEPDVVDRVLDADGRAPLRNPGALLLPLGGDARGRRGRAPSGRRRAREVLRSEHAHFGLVWEKAAPRSG